jgi:hypothetical protein
MSLLPWIRGPFYQRLAEVFVPISAVPGLWTIHPLPGGCRPPGPIVTAAIGSALQSPPASGSGRRGTDSAICS